MSNYFEYQDLVKVNVNDIEASGVLGLQANASIDDVVRGGVPPYNYASFEKDAYITSEPKRLAPRIFKVGILTSLVGNANGEISGQNLTLKLPSLYTVPGITLGCINKLKSVKISYYNESGVELNSKIFNEDYIENKLQFFSMAGEGVKSIKIENFVLEKPYHFLGIYRIDLGAIRIFDEANLIGADVNSYFSVDGSKLEYDVAKLKIFHEDDVEFAFLKKQPVIYKDGNGKVINKFYIETGESENEYISTLKAYDSVSNLEEKFLGGKYGSGNSDPYPFNQLLDDIFYGTDVKYIAIGTEHISLTGYIPICTKRKASIMICRGSNVRCFKSGGVLIFQPYYYSNNSVYSDSEIVENPSIKHNQTIGKLTVTKHNYEVSNEDTEVYNGYLKKGENTGEIIEFSQPVWKVLPYEVTKDPETDDDVVSDIVSTNVTFAESPSKSNNIANYVKIGKVSTSNKIVLKGFKISDNTEDVIVSRPTFDVNADYAEKTIDDITITSGIKDVANLLFALESTKKKQSFEVVEVDPPTVGNNVVSSLVESPIYVEVADEEENITGITRDFKITSVKDTLSGVYKVVAE